MHLIIDLIIGGIAGWLAAKIMNIDSSNVLQNIIVGLIGGIVGGIIGDLIGIHSFNFIGSTIIAFLGACLVIWIYHKVISK